MKDHYCECNAPCIHQKGIKVIYINDKAVKVSGCGNQRKDCNCKYIRPINILGGKINVKRMD